MCNVHAYIYWLNELMHFSSGQQETMPETEKSARTQVLVFT